MDNQPKLLNKEVASWETLRSNGLDEPKAVLLCALGRLVDRGNYPPYKSSELESIYEEMGYNWPGNFQVEQSLDSLCQLGYVSEGYTKRGKKRKGSTRRSYRVEDE